MRCKQVNIVGLAVEELQGVTLAELQATGEVWTLNDYYQFYNRVQPDRIYNIHQPPWVGNDPSRYTGDWKAQYNAAAAAGARIYTVVDIPDVLIQYALPTQALTDEFGADCMTCQVAVMIYHAILEKVEQLNIRGVLLSTDEYQYQATGILKAIDTAREYGIAVQCRPECKWREKLPTVDWSNINSGTAPYWTR